MRFYLSCLIVVFLSFGLEARSKPKAPFGLKWGMSIEELSEIADISKERSRKTLRTYNAKSLPKDLSIAEGHGFMFSDRYQLQKVWMVSKTIKRDKDGKKGKKAFAKLSKKLEKKYGKPKLSRQRIGQERYDEKDEFYQCLKHKGCGSWQAIYKDPKSPVLIPLSLKGLKSGKGYLRLTYEGPKWPEAMKRESRR